MTPTGGEVRLTAAFFGISLTLAAVLACSDKHPTDADEDTKSPDISQRDTAAIAGLIASNALPSARLYSAGVQGSNNAVAGEVAFVSAEPGTFPAKDSVFISNIARTAVVSSAKLVDGGFDPIPISAESGDLLELTVVVANGVRPEPLYVKVPPRRPPGVVRTVPRSGRIDVALNVHIEVVFSEPIDKSTVTTSSLILSENGKTVAGTVSVSEDGLSAELTPDNELEAGGSYDLNITGAIRDLSGYALTREPPITFVTAQEAGHIAFAFAGGAMYMMKADGTDWVQLGYGWAPAWMPDGSLLYVWQDCPQCTVPWQDCAECTRIPWIRTSNGNVRPFLPEAVSDGWSFNGASPTVDGSRVAFIRTKGSCRNHDGWCPIENSHELVIVTVRDFSLSKIPLPEGIVPLDKPSWSPDQSRVVFSCADKVDVQLLNVDLCFVNADGSGFVRFGRDGQWEWQPAWNPKTGVIAFTRSIDIGGDTWSYLASMVSEDGKDLHEYGYGEGAAWSPEGTTLLFCRPPLMAVSGGAQRVLYSSPQMAFLYELAWGRK